MKEEERERVAAGRFGNAEGLDDGRMREVDRGIILLSEEAGSSRAGASRGFFWASRRRKVTRVQFQRIPGVLFVVGADKDRYGAADASEICECIDVDQ